jgi:hypothetical protein
MSNKKEYQVIIEFSDKEVKIEEIIKEIIKQKIDIELAS